MFFEALHDLLGPIEPKALFPLLKHLASLQPRTQTFARTEKLFADPACGVVTVAWGAAVVNTTAYASMVPLLEHLRRSYGAPGGILEGRLLFRAELSFIAAGGRVAEHHASSHFHKLAERLHVPLITEGSNFESRWFNGPWQSFSTEPEHLYRFNNRVPHRVHNANPTTRVHAIFDYMKTADIDDYAAGRASPNTRAPVTPADPEYRFLGTKGADA